MPVSTIPTRTPVPTRHLARGDGVGPISDLVEEKVRRRRHLERELGVRVRECKQVVRRAAEPRKTGSVRTKTDARGVKPGRNAEESPDRARPRLEDRLRAVSEEPEKVFTVRRGGGCEAR